MMDAVKMIAFITTSSPAESKKIADGLLTERLAACVTVLPGATSRYWWKGKIASGKEQLLIAKTSKGKAPALIRRVKALHSYEVPEVVLFPIAAGNPDYLRWVGESLSGR